MKLEVYLIGITVIESKAARYGGFAFFVNNYKITIKDSVF